MVQQRPRFGPLREVPPDGVVTRLSGAAPGTRWCVARIGDDGGYPNGGIWRVTAERRGGPGPSSAIVKRTGASYLGKSPVWRCRADPDDPQWWGREAAFYDSDLATVGWPDGVRAARCYAIDDHDGCRDLWLEDVRIPAVLETGARAAFGLAGWQVANATAAQAHDWLGEDWIPAHVRRHGLDNQRTLAHPAWGLAIERGLDAELRDAVEARVTDPAEIRDRLAEFPQVLTHFDFHHANVGTVDGEVAVIDWAYAGWGPIGHDAGHLALDTKDVPIGEAWQTMRSAYCDGLVAAGWTGDLAVVRRSMTVSNQLRLGWGIDHLLAVADQLPEDTFAALSAAARFVADLR